jgi:hypothetical protein
MHKAGVVGNPEFGADGLRGRIGVSELGADEVVVGVRGLLHQERIGNNAVVDIVDGFVDEVVDAVCEPAPESHFAKPP